MKNISVKVIPPAIHILVWVGYVILYALLWRSPGRTFTMALVEEAVLLPFKLILVYTSLIILLPQFLFKRKYLLFIFLFAITSMACGVFNQIYVTKILPSSISGSLSDDLWDWDRITKRMTFINSAALFAITLEVIGRWFKQMEITKRLSSEKTIAELKLLRSQLHPHFFFNTLNNLYSLTLIKSDLAPKMILSLSELMRYILDKSGEDSVNLNDEIRFISNYVAVEKIRYEDKVSVQWNISIPAGNQIRIPPMLFITFIENAFKHGVSQERKLAQLEITLEERESSVYYCVTNSKIQQAEVNAIAAIPKETGTGLQNLKKRLDLIFSNNYSLQITEDRNYTASLTIPKDLL